MKDDMEYGENDKEGEDDVGNKKEKRGTGISIMLIGIILATTLMAFFIVNYQLIPVPEGKSANGDANATNRINMSEEEKDFRTWFILSYRPIIDDLKCVSKAAKIENFSQTETCARILKENSNRSLNQIESYNTSNISTNSRSGLILYKASLENYYIGGEKLEMGARNNNASSMSAAIRYIQNGTKYVNNAMNMLGNNTSGIKISSKGVKIN